MIARAERLVFWVHGTFHVQLRQGEVFFFVWPGRKRKKKWCQKITETLNFKVDICFSSEVFKWTFCWFRLYRWNEHIFMPFHLGKHFQHIIPRFRESVTCSDNVKRGVDPAMVCQWPMHNINSLLSSNLTWMSLFNVTRSISLVYNICFHHLTLRFHFFVIFRNVGIFCFSVNGPLASTIHTSIKSVKMKR